MATILVINAGSSSIKYRLLAMPAGRVLAHGLLERIGSAEASLHHADGSDAPSSRTLAAADHGAGLSAILSLLDRQGLLDAHGGLDAVGHRVVHGGDAFSGPVLIDEQVIAGLEASIELAPLHNAASLAGIRLLRTRRPELPQVAVFDTAFHHQLPDHARYYALPLAMQREHGIRRYGFHGLSHQYVAEATAQWLDRPLQGLKLISLHLGNGASACAIQAGRSIDTTMGFTPLEGLVMGTRCGDIDPALPGYLTDKLGLSGEQLDQLLNHHSGLQGLCGDSDMRRIEQRMADGDADARLAFGIFCYRIRKVIGAYFAALNGIDALIFTAGIGEHSAAVRAAVCDDLDALGITVDAHSNASAGQAITRISPPHARVPVLVVPTDEERQIAAATLHRLTTGNDVLSSAGP